MKNEKLKELVEEMMELPASNFSVWEIGFICYMAEKKGEYNLQQATKIKAIYSKANPKAGEQVE